MCVCVCLEVSFWKIILCMSFSLDVLLYNTCHYVFNISVIGEVYNDYTRDTSIGYLCRFLYKY